MSVISAKQRPVIGIDRNVVSDDDECGALSISTAAMCKDAFNRIS